MHPAKEKLCYIVALSLIEWVHTPCKSVVSNYFILQQSQQISYLLSPQPSIYKAELD